MALPNYRQAAVGGPGGVPGARKSFIAMKKTHFNHSIHLASPSQFDRMKLLRISWLAACPLNGDLLVF
jgi:hypothetical protein